MAVDPKEWFDSLPPVTKTYFVAAVSCTVAVSFGILDVRWLYLDWEKVFHSFEIWRPFTCFLFFGKLSFPFIFQMFILVRYFSQVESAQFRPSEGKTAEMVTFVGFGAVIMLVIAFFWRALFFLGPALCFMVLYYWSRIDPFQVVSLYGFAIKASMLPFVMLGMALIMQSSPVLDILGIVVGHIYILLKLELPLRYGWTPIPWTPDFMHQLFDQRFQPSRTRFRGRGYSLQ
eukprot:CAMPEP_0114498876 /NCGR_PEP_ID=MMETSP0109-20121206/7112_1 /TAXON_ID=29199 /ORGANISM="Chlorarachnion reptans, Strain CCCM449" /LENGTH=230 /DNA_ID=CAMNT_0001676395 /DNA_START=1017 /DNA_END=1709 /DNA_ORIENTATION=-